VGDNARAAFAFARWKGVNGRERGGLHGRTVCDRAGASDGTHRACRMCIMLLVEARSSDGERMIGGGGLAATGFELRRSREGTGGAFAKELLEAAIRAAGVAERWRSTAGVVGRLGLDDECMEAVRVGDVYRAPGVIERDSDAAAAAPTGEGPGVAGGEMIDPAVDMDWDRM
jgi:hypothetical protein